MKVLFVIFLFVLASCVGMNAKEPSNNIAGVWVYKEKEGVYIKYIFHSDGGGRYDYERFGVGCNCGYSLRWKVNEGKLEAVGQQLVDQLGVYGEVFHELHFTIESSGSGGVFLVDEETDRKFIYRKVD